MEYILDDNKKFKQAIKKHELKQVCAWPMGCTIVRIYVTTKEPLPHYFRSTWTLDDTDKIQIVNAALPELDAHEAISNRYINEVHSLRASGNASEHIAISRDVANGKGLVSRSMDARKWHKLRADVLQFMLKDCRVPEECPTEEGEEEA